jgi:hypothetical protein
MLSLAIQLGLGSAGMVRAGPSLRLAVCVSTLGQKPRATERGPDH